MGMQAHIRTKSIIKYEGQPFYNTDCEDVRNYLVDNDLMAYESSSEYDYVPNWEINREALIEHIYSIKQEDFDKIAFGEHTYGELVKIFSEWLEISSHEENYSNNDIIFIDWL